MSEYLSDYPYGRVDSNPRVTLRKRRPKRKWTPPIEELDLPVKKFKVARHVLNIVRARVKLLLAFVYNVTHDVGDEGRSVVDMECLDALWFYRVWSQEMGGTAIRLPDLFAKAGAPGGFDDVFFNLETDDQSTLFRAHSWFVGRMLLDDDPAPVALLHMIGPRRQWITEAHWYWVSVSTNTRMSDGVIDWDDERDWSAVYNVLDMDDQLDPEPVWTRVMGMDFIWLPDRVLKALHLPQTPPTGFNVDGMQMG